MARTPLADQLQRTGQYQRFAGAEGQREGWAVETGERAATEILSDLK